LGGILLIAAIAKLKYLMVFGALGAGMLRLRQLLTKRRRTTGRPMRAKTDRQ